MPNKDSSSKISSFEEAMRKFEEALRQSQEMASGRGVPGPGQPRRPGPAQPPWGQPPNWSRPDGTPGAFDIDDPTLSQDDMDEGETLEHADWRGRAADAAGTYAVRADAFNGHSEEGGLGESISSEGVYSETSEGSRSRLSGLTEITESGDLTAASNWWDETAIDAVQRSRAGALPPALAHLDRTRNPLVQGVIWAEVLGRPVSKRRGRGRNGI